MAAANPGRAKAPNRKQGPAASPNRSTGTVAGSARRARLQNRRQAASRMPIDLPRRPSRDTGAVTPSGWSGRAWVPTRQSPRKPRVRLSKPTSTVAMDARPGTGQASGAARSSTKSPAWVRPRPRPANPMLPNPTTPDRSLARPTRPKPMRPRTSPPRPSRQSKKNPPAMRAAIPQPPSLPARQAPRRPRLNHRRKPAAAPPRSSGPIRFLP